MKVATFLLVFVAITIAAPSPGKISPKIQKALQEKNRLNILVYFESTKETLHSLSGKIKGMKHGERTTAVYQALKAHALKSQASALQILQSPTFFAFQIKSFWISNQIYIQGAEIKLIEALADLEEVHYMDEEVVITLDELIPSQYPPKAVWGIEIIQTEQAWAVAGNGTGGVVGIIDTGARHTHEAIKGGYRGVTHSWYDPYLRSRNPRDGDGHGTHVTGTIAGINGIGVAPGSKWISCKGLDDFGSGTENALIACAEFMLCPHEYNGDNPDCSLAPHVVSNSWGSPGGDTFYDRCIEAWHAANIIPVFAAGNSGPECYTIGSPSDSTSSAISVAATNIRDAISEFSSRGPSEHAGAHKPDIAAPGEDIRSASIASDTAYESFSGTSMACPHVAGVVMFIKSNNPEASYETIVKSLTSAADQDLTFGTTSCDGVYENEFPNYAFGHGRINALEAVQASLRIK